MPNQGGEVYFICCVLLLVTCISIGLVVLKMKDKSHRTKGRNEIHFMSNSMHNEIRYSESDSNFHRRHSEAKNSNPNNAKPQFQAHLKQKISRQIV